MAKKGLTFHTDLDTYEADASPIGEGGSGRVYVATGADGADYAIKVLDPARATTSKQKRFANELNFGRRIRHDHIVPIIDSGVLELEGKQTPFFVMPRYEASLRTLISSGIDAPKVLSLFDGLLAALEFAHGRGVWHRDVKPENVLFDGDTGRLVLADFGIAHFEDDDLHAAILTKDVERLANFAYAAPEQREKGAEVDGRADIYAAGLILVEMFTGRIPHGTGYKKIGEIAPRQSFADAVAERMIRSSPADRYDAIAPVRKDLHLLSAGSGLSKARAVGALVSAAQEKARLFRSSEGGAAVREQVAAIFEYIVSVLEQTARDHPMLGLQWEAADQELIVRSKRSSARVNWYQAFSNVLDKARLTMRTYKWRLSLPSEGRRYRNSVEPEEMAEKEFWPDYSTEGLCWSEDGRRLTSTEAADRIIEEFFALVERHENSDEQPF